MKQLLKKTIISITVAVVFIFMNKPTVLASTQEKILDFTIDPIWSKLYGGSRSDELRSLAPTSDGGFVGAGYTYDGASLGGVSYGDYDGLLVKYSKYGEPEFSSEYGGNLADTFYSINQTSDGGYITCGYTQSNKSGTITTDLLGDDDGLLVKFSPTGSVEWERRFGTTGAKWQNYTSCRNITENHDGTYTMVGYHFGNNNGDILDPNNGQRDGYISKVAQNGDIIWTQVFGGTSNDSFNAAYELPDGSFIVAGQSQSSNSGEITATNKGNYDALLAKFDKDGNPVWNRLYGGSGSENFEALSVNSAGEVVVVGSTNSQNGDFLTDGNIAYGGVDGLVGKFDSSGRVMWHKTIGGSGSDYVYSVIDTNEGKYLLSGTSTSSSSGIITDANNGSTDGLVIAINEDGSLDWNHLFGGTGDDTFEDSVAVDNGGGYVVGGYSSSSNSGTINDSNNGEDDTLLVKFATNNTPTINAPPFVELNIGDAYDPLLDVAADDFEDGDVTKDINVTNNVDINTPGVYITNYSVTDFDRNETNGQQIVLINDGSYSYNDEYIMHADDVTHKIAQVRTDDASIISQANIKVFDKLTGLEITDPDITVDKGDYQAANGVYPITFSYNGANITSTFTVDNGKVPVITGDNFFTSNLGDVFNTASKITVSDVEDGPITTYDIDDSKLDTDKLGVYPIEISVVDSDGNIAEKTIFVAIIDDTATITDDYVFYNVDYSQRVGQYTLDKDYHLTNSGIKVYSKATGQLIDNSNIMIQFNDYQQKVGVYNINFFVKDTLDQFATSEVTVVKGDSPVISGPDYLEVNQGEPYVDPYGGISIRDKEDDVIANSKLTSDITIDTNKPGVYIITYTVMDSDFNQDTFSQTVVVKNDKMAIDDNYIIYAEDYQLRVGQVTHDVADITKYSKLQVYDKAAHKLLDTSFATIDSSALKAEPGTYPVTIAIDDLERTIYVTVVTGQAPTISGKSYIEVNNGSSTDFTTSLDVNDLEDSDLSTADLTVIGTVDVMTPGVYELEYKVTDSDGNEDTFKQQIVVKSDNTTINNQYVIFGNDYEIYVSQVAQTTAQIIERSDLKIYDKVNKTYIDNPTVNIDDSAVKAKAGVYPLYVTYDGLRHQINVTVINGHKPVIHGADYAEITKGTSFDPLAKITLSDDEDTDLTSDMIKVTGTVDVNKPGVYNLVYSYTDSDNNTTTVNRMVVVKDENMVINNNYIIYANDYSTTVKNLDLSNTAVIKLSGLKVYNKIANEYVTNPNVVIDTSKVKPNGGIYPVKISYLGLVRTINVTVLSGENPVISGEQFSVITQGSHFNSLLGMEVTDKEDGPINPTALKVSGTVDTLKPGVYKLVYSYVDSDNNKTNFSREVVVSNKDTQINDEYVIYAHDYSTFVSNASTASNFIMNNSEGYVYNRNTKEYLTLNQIDIERGLLENKPGIYEVKIGKDETFKSITVTVSAGTKPQINIADTVVEANTGDKLNIEDLITYQDLETPYGKLVVTYETDYDPNKVGVYEVNYTVTDLDGNVQTAKLKIFVNDGSYVTNNKNALSATDVTYNLSNEQSLEQYIIENANIHAYDFNLETEMDLSNLKINLENVKNKPGTYEVYLSLNGLTKTINVTITKDDENNSEVTSEQNSEHNSEVTSEENSEHNIEVTSEQSSEVTSEQSSEASKLQITGNRLYLINILILCAASLCLIIIKRQLS